MIVVKEFPDKEFASKEDLFKALRENKTTLIAQKKMITKEADSVIFSTNIESKKEASKEDGEDNISLTKLKAKLAINTTNLMDSHSDVHFDGIWNKSTKEQKNILLLQEHQMKFNYIISDNVVASVKKMTWKSLGFDFEESTEVLIFDTEIDKNRNEFMFNQYSKGYVKEHSVGMRYVKLELAINSESKWDEEEKAVWDKYIEKIVNKDVAENQGYFWAVTEAKIVEGSAVVKGSNYATPVISIQAEKSLEEQKEEPSNDTQANEKLLKELLNKF